MKMIIIGAILAMALSGCSPTNIAGTPSAPTVTDDPTFRDYKLRFFNYGYQVLNVDLSGDDTPIAFDSIEQADEDVIAACVMYKSGNRVVSKFILVRPDAWITMNDTEAEITINHELGHCNLWRDHIEQATLGVPDSIMYPRILDPTLYQSRLTEYVRELFENSGLGQSYLSAISGKKLHKLTHVLKRDGSCGVIEEEVSTPDSI
nr:hypothetical protein BdHM001_35550 [Bdellovibrio sp. HM001]